MTACLIVHSYDEKQRMRLDKFRWPRHKQGHQCNSLFGVETNSDDLFRRAKAVSPPKAKLLDVTKVPQKGNKASTRRIK
jgi:hypothetical protein